MPEFNAIHGRDGLTFLVGEGGRILRWTGEVFAPMPSPTRRDLACVFVRAADEAYAVGGNGTLLRFDGSVWTALDSHTSEQLLAVHAPRKGEVWVGGNRVLLRFCDGTLVLTQTFSRFSVRGIEPGSPEGEELWFLGGEKALLRGMGRRCMTCRSPIRRLQRRAFAS